MTTLQPLEARLRATSTPIPLDAPVTIAFLPSRMRWPEVPRLVEAVRVCAGLSAMLLIAEVLGLVGCVVVRRNGRVGVMRTIYGGVL